jgi:hypothetical protein
MRVRLTPVALEDIAAIYQAHSAGFAKRAEDAVFDALDSFATFPVNAGVIFHRRAGAIFPQS